MATLFQKGRIALLATANSILDKWVDLNSVEAVKQYARDLHVSLDSVGTELAGARADVTGAKRRVASLTTQQSELNAKIEAILGNDIKEDDHLANVHEATLMGVEEGLKIEQENLETATQTVQGLEQAMSALQTKYAIMAQQIGRLESLERQARGKERAAGALHDAKDAMGAGGEVSVDDVAARIQKRADTATEKLKMEQSDFAATAGTDTVMADVAARIAMRKAKMAAGKEATS